ncbi:fimbrial protein [Brenneria goodwinii]|uniref:fimbrial protein n=1 Tax=Brenneria goodwinii TaxID=1109412 RepID=UPI0036E89436
MNKKITMDNAVIGKTVAGLLLVGGLMAAPSAMAEVCYSDSSEVSALTTFSWGGTTVIDFGSVSVSPTAQVGDVIATVDYGYVGGADPTGFITFCDYRPSDLLIFSINGKNNASGFLDTGIDGLGIRMTNTSASGPTWILDGASTTYNSAYDITAAATLSIDGVATSGYGLSVDMLGYWRFELVKTADTVSSGASDTSTFTLWTDGIEFNLPSLTIWTWSFSPFTVTAEACSINGYDTSVDLGTATTPSFTAVGATANSTDFTINMICSSTGISPTLTFSGTVDDDVSAVFANDSGTATGVGVQLLYGNTAITPDTAVSLGMAPSTSATDYAFKARLYQTAGAVTAGSVDTSVIFTMGYE